jgi:hypothetical protein
LTATGYKVKGIEFADLSWSPTIAGDHVNISRDSIPIATADPDDGAYTDNVGAKGNNDTYVYQVCRVETGECSNLATVKFGTK